MKEHNSGSTEHIAIYIVDERVLCFLFFNICQHVCETEQNSESPRHENSYEKTLRAIRASLSDDNESAK